MKNSWKYENIRHFRTLQEMAANDEDRDEGRRIKWGRAKRNPRYLDPWSYDRTHNEQKSWKKKRKQQYNIINNNNINDTN